MCCWVVKTQQNGKIILRHILTLDSSVVSRLKQFDTATWDAIELTIFSVSQNKGCFADFDEVGEQYFIRC